MVYMVLMKSERMVENGFEFSLRASGGIPRDSPTTQRIVIFHSNFIQSKASKVLKTESETKESVIPLSPL